MFRRFFPRKARLAPMQQYQHIILAPAARSEGDLRGSFRSVAQADLVVVGRKGYVTKNRYGRGGPLSNQDYKNVIEEVERRLLAGDTGFDPPDMVLER